MCAKIDKFNVHESEPKTLPHFMKCRKTTKL